ncbi:AAA domain protein, partial [Vibrio parahaemolyticus EKP-021]
CYA